MSELKESVLCKDDLNGIGIISIGTNDDDFILKQQLEKNGISLYNAIDTNKSLKDLEWSMLFKIQCIID